MYDFVIERFGEAKIISRYEWLFNLMQDYIEAEKIADRVFASDDIMNHVIIDYFVDIYRLKEFQDIEKTHDSKIYAYLISWILRHKPIQIKNEGEPSLAFINEKFCVEMLRGYLFKNPKNVSIVNSHKETVDTFIDTLLYYFKYRDYSAKKYRDFNISI